VRVPLGLIAAVHLSCLLTQDLPFKIEVIDGDTVRWMGERVRLMGFDAPELHRAKCDAERELGLRAADRMRGLAGRPGAHLVFSGKREKYGRELAQLITGGEDAAQIMIREGLAHPYFGRKKEPWCDGE
jgi:micrococcal nuclease